MSDAVKEQYLRPPVFFAGLDLGQTQDFSALAILERTEELVEIGEAPTVKIDAGMGKVIEVSGDPPKSIPKPRTKKLRHYAVRHLDRYDLGTPYPKMVHNVVSIFSQEPLAGGTLVVDQTGVGRPVVDMFVAARPKAVIRPVTITAGVSVSQVGSGWHVPKKELVSVLQVLLQSRRIRVAKRIPNSGVLVKELEAFRVKITKAANETFEAWRERDHDDLVLAVALAVWVSEKGSQEFWVR